MHNMQAVEKAKMLINICATKEKVCLFENRVGATPTVKSIGDGLESVNNGETFVLEQSTKLYIKDNKDKAKLLYDPSTYPHDNSQTCRYLRDIIKNKRDTGSYVIMDKTRQYLRKISDLDWQQLYEGRTQLIDSLSLKQQIDCFKQIINKLSPCWSLKSIFDKSAIVNYESGSYKRTVLGHSCFADNKSDWHGNIDVELLLSMTTLHINRPDKNGSTPLLLACQDLERHRPDKRMLLLQMSTIDVNAAPTKGLHKGETPLWALLSASVQEEEKIKRNMEIIKLLRAKGGSIKHQNSKGETALFAILVAPDAVSKPIVTMLVANGVSVNHQNKKGVSALYTLCNNEGNLNGHFLLNDDLEQFRRERIRFILQLPNIEINQQNTPKRQTALWIACKTCRSRWPVQLLALQGASPTIPNGTGKTADWAANQNQKEMLNIQYTLKYATYFLHKYVSQYNRQRLIRQKMIIEPIVNHLLHLGEETGEAIADKIDKYASHFRTFVFDNFDMKSSTINNSQVFQDFPR
tara:strand:- start:95 stop:1657 length:1563 start_codon:yes stop_codon:yes gene_type:complete